MRARRMGGASGGSHDARSGLTLPEVLIACALLAILGSAVAGLLLAGARLQATTAERAARTRALEPYAVPGGRPEVDLPGCDTLDGAEDGTVDGTVDGAVDGTVGGRDDGPGQPRACVRERRRCHLDGATVRCDGTGTLLRVDIDVLGSGGERPPLRVWQVVP